jgi:hypothetical protein
MHVPIHPDMAHPWRVPLSTRRERRGVTNGLAEGVQALAARSGQTEQSSDVQLVAQVASVPGYAQWREARAALWKAQGRQWNTKTWPKTLSRDALACLVLPLPVGTRVAGTLQPVAPPLMASGRPVEGDFARREDGVVLAVISAWVDSIPETVAIRLAPPLVERFVRGEIVETYVADFGLRWPLALPATA